MGSVNFLEAALAGGGTALSNAGQQLAGNTDPLTGIVGVPYVTGVPAGTFPATSTSAAPPSGNANQAPTAFSIPTWVYIVGGVALLLIVGAVIMKSGGGK